MKDFFIFCAANTQCYCSQDDTRLGKSYLFYAIIFRVTRCSSREHDLEYDMSLEILLYFIVSTYFSE